MLKLAKLPDRTPVRITINVNPALNRDLGAYADAYRQVYGAEESIALFKVLVEHHDGVFLNSNFVLYSGIFLGIFYGVAFVGTFVNHRIERFSLRIRTAISLIDQREKSLGPVA